MLAPERILSLLALATPYLMYGGRRNPPEQVNAHWYQWYFQLQLAEKSLTEGAEAFCRQLWRSWSPDWNFSKREFAQAAEAWTNPQFVRTVLHYYRTRWGGALSLRAYAEAQAKLEAKPKAKIAVPTLYVQGADDACDLAPCSEDQATEFTGPYERVLLKGSGHFPHREDPRAIAKLLTRTSPNMPDRSTVGPNGTDISTDDGRYWCWNALSLPLVVGPHGRIGKLRTDALTAPPSKAPNP